MLGRKPLRKLIMLLGVKPVATQKKVNYLDLPIVKFMGGVLNFEKKAS